MDDNSRATLFSLGISDEVLASKPSIHEKNTRKATTNYSTLEYLKVYHPTIFARELYPLEQEPRKFRFIIISLVPFEIVLCKKSTAGPLEYINKLKFQEEFLLLANIGDTLVGAKFLSELSNEIEILVEFTLTTDRVSLYIEVKKSFSHDFDVCLEIIHSRR